MNEFGLKELYDVSIKTTYPIEVNGRTIEIGETIAAFDKIQWADFKELRSVAAARGGYGNSGLVWWEETKEVRLSFMQGVFSKTQLGLMTNSGLVLTEKGTAIEVPMRETVESNEQGQVILKHPAKDKGIFVYDEETGRKISDWIKQPDGSLLIGTPFTNVVVDYIYPYDNGYSTLTIGQRFTQGFLSLTGKTRIKDETTGQVKTGILTIPKLKLMSDLSLRLGSDAIPLTGSLDAIAVPVGNRGQKRVLEIIFLNDDIDSDM